jgi:hypothetical protein
VGIITLTLNDAEVALILDALAALALRDRRAEVFAFLVEHADLPLMANVPEPTAEEDR